MLPNPMARRARAVAVAHPAQVAVPRSQALLAAAALALVAVQLLS